MTNPLKLSFSRVTTYNTCPKRYKYEYISDLPRPDTSSTAMQIGSLLHLGIEEIILGNGLRSGVGAILQADGVSDFARNKALDLIRFYHTFLKLDDVTPFMREGKPLIEYWIDATFPSNPDFGFRGIVDAVLKRGNDVVLIDWKSRGTFYNPASIEHDAQLYLYAHFLMDVLGVPLTKALQVQLSSTPPGAASLTQKGELSKTVGATLRGYWRDSVTSLGLNPDDHEKDMEKRGKFKEPGYFAESVEIDLNRRHEYVDAFLQSAQALSDDTVFRPVLSASTCRYCPFLEPCKGQ